jgi:hypothetical protein
MTMTDTNINKASASNHLQQRLVENLLDFLEKKTTLENVFQFCQTLEQQDAIILPATVKRAVLQLQKLKNTITEKHLTEDNINYEVNMILNRLT